MIARLAGFAALALLSAACAATGPQVSSPPLPAYARIPSESTLPKTSGQGWFGVSELETRDVDVDPGTGNVVDVDDADMPVIGGVIQHALAGERVQVGLEGGLGFGWRGNVEAVAVGGGGAVIAADSDFLLSEFFGGPYITLPLGQKTRVYGAAGFSLQWGWFDFEWVDPVTGFVNAQSDGFGDGVYGRTGIEFSVGRGTWIGFCFRVVDSSFDPGGKIDSVDVRQEQYLFTVRTWM
jgi:hypothetical protein